MVRRGNPVGIVEIKSGRDTRKALGRLNTAGGRAFPGICTAQFPVADQSRAALSNQHEPAELRGITVMALRTVADREGRS